MAQPRPTTRAGRKTGRPLGRPPSADPRSHAVNLRLTESEWKTLQALAAARGVTASEALRSLIPGAIRELVREVAEETGRGRGRGSP
jgi:hypothetical protein